MMQCSLYKPLVLRSGRVVVVPTLQRASAWQITCWIRDSNTPGETERYVREVRAAHKAGDEDAKTLAKSMLWSFTPCGVVMDGSKRTKDDIRWASRTQLIAIDIDHATESERLRNEMASIPHTVASWVSASGAGVKTLMLMDDVGKTAEEYTRAWFAACAYLERLGYAVAHGSQIDTPGSYWNGIQFLSRDPGAFYNDNPLPLCVADYPAPSKPHVAPVAPLAIPRTGYSTSYGPASSKPTSAEVSWMLGFVKPTEPDGFHWMRGKPTVLDIADALADWGGSAAEGLFYDWIARVGYDRNDPKDAWRRAMQPGKPRNVSFGSLWYWAVEGGWSPPSRPAKAPLAFTPRPPTPTAEEEDPEDWMK